MSDKRRGCVNDPDIFCYICGSFVPSVQRQNITTFVKNVYYAYFGVELGDQDKAWAPHKVCRNCVFIEAVEHWKAKVFGFGVPMVWREPNGHGKQCYFCSCVQVTDCSKYEYGDDQQPKPFNQAELNDLVRDLNLPKTSALILGSRLKAKRMLCTDTTFVWYKYHEKDYIFAFLPWNTL